MIATLGESGLSSRDASWATDTLTYYVVGHTIEEQLAVALPDREHDATARLTDAVDPQRHPHMHAALAHIPAPHYQEHFIAAVVHSHERAVRSQALGDRLADAPRAPVTSAVLPDSLLISHVSSGHC